jgi:hypothetical protein
MIKPVCFCQFQGFLLRVGVILTVTINIHDHPDAFGFYKGLHDHLGLWRLSTQLCLSDQVVVEFAAHR